MSEYLRRTAITRLSLTSRQAELLEETLDAWRDGCNLAARIGLSNDHTSKRKLQSAAYDVVRTQTALGSQHAVLATHSAAEAVKSITELRNSGNQASDPEFTSPTIKYDARTLTLFPEDEEISLSTTQGRIRCGLELPRDPKGYQWQFIDSADWELTESTLTVRDGGYYVHLGFRKRISQEADSDETAEDSTVLGVDLGMENLAVTSTARFESGSELRHNHQQFDRVRQGLQETGTQSAHRTLVELGDREKRYTRDEMHRISKAIVTEALEHECDYIAFEDLRYIQDTMPSIRRFKQWAHRCLLEFVEYKAEAHGIDVIRVDAENTSCRCFDCGHISKKNRVSRDEFRCHSCGAQANADYNAAKNIGWRCVRRGHQSSRRTGNRQLALKSGTVTPSNGFELYPPTRDVAESTDKPQASESGE